MKIQYRILAVLIVILFASCEEYYYQGEYIIINKCSESIDIYTEGRNAPSLPPGGEIHDHVPANGILSLRKIEITNKASVKDVFVYIKIYQNSVVSIKNPMEQYLWNKEMSDNGLTYTLVVDSTFFK